MLVAQAWHSILQSQSDQIEIAASSSVTCCLSLSWSAYTKHVFLYRWKMKKLSYDERKAALVSRLNALNEEGDE